MTHIRKFPKYQEIEFPAADHVFFFTLCNHQQQNANFSAQAHFNCHFAIKISGYIFVYFFNVPLSVLLLRTKNSQFLPRGSPSL